MFNFSHAARVTPNRVCCNALLAAYARAKPQQWHKVRGAAACPLRRPSLHPPSSLQPPATATPLPCIQPELTYLIVRPAATALPSSSLARRSTC